MENLIYVSADGDDANSGEQASPLKTISAASAKVQSGQLVLIGPGVYEEQLNDLTGGRNTLEHVVYQGLDPDQPPVIRPSIGSNRALYLTTSYVTIRQLVLDGINCRYDCVKITRSGTSAARDVRIIDCVIKNGFENGVLISGKPQGVRDVVIRDCQVHDNGRSRRGHGVYIAVDHVAVEGCNIYRNAAWGIHAYHPDDHPSWIKITNNHVHHNGVFEPSRGAGIGVYFGSEVELSGNDVHDNPRPVLFNTGIGGL